MIRTSLSGVLILMMMVSGQALAGPVSYNWIEGGYSRLNVDLGNQGTANEDGWHFGGSVALGESVYLTGRYDRWDINNVTLDIGRIGVGMRGALDQNTDWFGDISYIRSDAGSPVNITDDGALGRVGARTRVSEMMEFGIFGGYAVDGPDGDTFVLGGNAMIHFIPNLGLNLSIESYEFDVNIFRASLRATF